MAVHKHRLVLGIVVIALAIAAIPPPSAAEPQAQRKVAYVPPELCHYQDLCDALVRQAQKVLDEGGDLCSVPYEDRHHGMRLPDWRPVDPTQHLSLLSRALPDIGYYVHQFEKKIAGEKPGSPPSELAKRTFWQRYGQRLIEAIAAGRATLEATRLNFDNTGPEEQVYRVTQMEPVDKANPEGPWQAVRCSLPSFDPPVPYYGLFLGDEDEKRIGSAQLDRLIAYEDLIIYRGRTYAASRGPGGPYAAWIRSLSQTGEAFLSPAAEVLTNRHTSN